MSHGQTGRNWIWGYDEKQDKWTGSFQSPVMGLDFSPAQSHLASGGNDTLVWIWEVPSGKPITSLNAHKQGIAKLLFTPDGKYLVTAGQDHKIFIWDAMTYDLLNECDYLIEPFLDSFNTIMLGTNYRGDILYFYGYQSFEDLTANNKDPGTVYFVDLPGCQLVHKIDDKTIKQVFFTTNDEELILVHDDHIEEYQIR
jgi:WD40 repeat protein